jgi:hypothetical protein
MTLAITTALKATQKFTVDGVEYQLFDMDHLSPDEEAEALALFSRFGILAQGLDATANVKKGVELAKRMRVCREQVVARMTDLPADVIANIPLSQLSLIMEAMQNELEGAEDDAALPVVADDEAEAELLAPDTEDGGA